MREPAEQGASGPAPPAERPLVALALCLLLALVVLAPALRELGGRGGWNWASFRGSTQADVTTLLRHGEFPLWNPWRAGGMVGFAEPQSMFLTPVTPLAMAFGVMPALKLACVLAVALGAFGMWRLAGRLGLSGVARALPPLLLCGSSVPAQYVAFGPLPWLYGLALLPWMLLCFERSLDDNRFVLGAGLCWGGMVCCGDTWHFSFAPLLLGLWAAARAVQRRSLRPLLLAGAAGLVGLCLLSVRIAPMLDVYAQFPRHAAMDTRFVTPSLLLQLLVDPFVTQGTHTSTLITVRGVSVEWYDCFAYVGVPALLAALLALLRPRRVLAPALIVLVFAWIACGPSLRPNLWGLLSDLPVLRSMRVPERFTLYVLFGVALLAGFGIERLRRGRAAAAGLVAAACLLPVLWLGWPLLASAFAPPLPELPAPGEFRQESVVRAPGDAGAADDQQAAILMNLGNLTANHDLPVPGRVKPADSPLYRGEVFLRGGHGSVEADITPNTLRVRAELDAPDVLVVNQNWFPGWAATGSVVAALHDDGGRPALALPAGRHELELRFTQPSVAKGAWITLLAAVVALLYLLASRGVAARDGFGLREGVALAALAALAIAQGAPRPAVPDAAPAETPAAPARRIVPTDSNLFELAATLQPGDTLALPSRGPWFGPRITRGLTLEGPGDGAAALAGPLIIEHVPLGEEVTLVGRFDVSEIRVADCAGTVRLQDVTVREGGLSITSSERVHLLGSTVQGPLRVDHSVLTVSGTRLGLAVADHAWLFLSGVEAEAVGARGSMVSAEGCERVQLELRDGSRARLSGGVARLDADASSRVVHLDRPPPRVLGVRPVPDALLVSLRGTPGTSGLLLLGDGTTLQAWGEDDNFYLVDMVGWVETRRYTLPDNGLLELTVPRPPGLPACFAQTGIERTEGRLDLDLSLLAGVLLRTDVP